MNYHKMNITYYLKSGKVFNLTKTLLDENGSFNLEDEYNKIYNSIKDKIFISEPTNSNDNLQVFAIRTEEIEYFKVELEADKIEIPKGPDCRIISEPFSKCLNFANNIKNRNKFNIMEFIWKEK